MSLDSFRFIASVAADSALERAKDCANSIASSADQMKSDIAAIDLSKIRETTIEKVNTAKTTIETATNNAASAAASAAQSTATLVNNSTATLMNNPTVTLMNVQLKQYDNEGSEADSFTDDRANTSTSLGALGNFVPSSVQAQLGFAAQRSSEKESLVPKRGGADPGKQSSSVNAFTISIPTSFGDLSTNAKSLFGVAPTKEPEDAFTRLKSCTCCPALTYQQRLIGFATCFFFGAILSLSALSSLGSLLIGNAAPFAFKYTLGNLLSLGSSSFLVGPAKQCRDMSSPERRTASMVYVVTLCGTLWSVFKLKIQLVSFAFILLQFCALTWYMLSYIPYGQQCIRRLALRTMS